MQLKFISNLFISKHVSLAKVAIVCLEIRIVQKSRRIKYIDSKPRLLRRKLVTKLKNLGFHPIDIYISRPTIFEELTFMQYFKQYTHDSKIYSIYNTFEKDDIGFIIYENEKLIRFTNFHPVYNSEAFF
jgi:hypothetical protein